MNPTVPQFNVGGSPYGNPYAQQALNQTTPMQGGFIEAPSPAPGQDFGFGAPGTYSNRPPDIASFSTPAKADPGSPSGGMDSASPMSAAAGGPGGEPQMSQAEMDALLQMLSGAGGSGGGIARMAGPSTPKGVGGHNAQGSIVMQPDGSAWDMSNGKSGGMLNLLNPANLFSMKGAAALAAGVGAAGLGMWFFKSRGAKELFANEKKDLQDFIEAHSGRVKELTEAIQAKSQEKITSLKQAVLDALKTKVLNPFKETLDTDAKKAIAQATEEQYAKPYELAAGVTDGNADSLVSTVTKAFEEALEQLRKFKSDVAEKAT